MKKLMLTAAAVAMAGVASAATQVYDIKFNIKTTTCKTTTIAKDQNPFRLTPGKIEYRTQGSLAIQGLIWACGCDYLVDLGVAVEGASTTKVSAGWQYYVFADGAAYNPGAGTTAEGYIFWNAKTKAPWGYAKIDKLTGGTPTVVASWIPTAGEAMPTFQWTFLQRFGARAEKVEGVWTLTDLFSTQNKYDLMGAGFGSSKQLGTYDPAAAAPKAGAFHAHPVAPAVTFEEECDDAIIASMSGNLAGYIDASDNGCVFCGNQGCPAYIFCRCYVDKFDGAKTAAYGTWTLKYNAALSTKLMSYASIRDIYKFSAQVDEYVQWLEANAL